MTSIALVSEKYHPQSIFFSFYYKFEIQLVDLVTSITHMYLELVSILTSDTCLCVYLLIYTIFI